MALGFHRLGQMPPGSEDGVLVSMGVEQIRRMMRIQARDTTMIELLGRGIYDIGRIRAGMVAVVDIPDKHAQQSLSISY